VQRTGAFPPLHAARCTLHGVAALTVLLGLAPHAVAQGFTVTGRVLQGGPADSVPAPGLWAVLHAVGREGGGGAVDSARTDRAGRYAVRDARRDTNAIYLVSTTYRGITYFTGGLLPEGARDTAETLVVYDTSSTGPPVHVAERHIVVRTPDADGTRRTLELLVLANPGALTRIAPDSTIPVWTGRLPAGAAGFETGESDVSAEAVRALGDTVIVMAPIPPGRKQVLYTYLLPRTVDALRLTTTRLHERLTVLLEDTAAVLTGGDLEPRGIQVFEDAQFAMYEGRAVPAGADITFRFGPPAVSTSMIQVILLAAAALVLVGTLVLWLRRQRPDTADASDALAREIAALDGAFESRADTASPAERAAYEGRRRRLKERLEAALAARRAGS
jgi:hypothetical protein